jgi:ribosomal protein S18 acetylase RimI-like enzyme
MTTTAQSIQAIGTGEQDRAIAALTAAFSSDPVVRWVLPEARQYLTYFPPFVNAFAGRAFGHESAFGAEGFAGAALWLPPDVGSDDEAMGAIMMEAVLDADKEEVFGFVGQMEAFHPHEPHWYLPLIGVDPAYQGRGIGAALLRHALSICDRQRKIAYLEATSPRNKELYARHGFVETGVIQFASSPPMWPMTRDPR